MPDQVSQQTFNAFEDASTHRTHEQVPEDSLIAIVKTLVSDYTDLVAETHASLATALKGSSVLVVDAALGIPSARLEKTKNWLIQLGYGQLAEVIISEFFPNSVPNTTTAWVQEYLGPQIGTIHSTIEDPGSVSDKIAAVLITGSPADVSKFDQDLPISYGNWSSPLSHQAVYQRTLAINKQRREAGLPGIGICYGHAFAAHLNDYEIYRLDEGYQQGILDLSSTNNDAKKTLFANHGDVVKNGTGNGIDLFVSTQSPEINHALIASQGFQSNGDPKANMANMRQRIEDGHPFTLGYQAHPEQTIFFLAIELIRACIEDRQTDQAFIESLMLSTHASLARISRAIARKI